MKSHVYVAILPHRQVRNLSRVRGFSAFVVVDVVLVVCFVFVSVFLLLFSFVICLFCLFVLFVCLSVCLLFSCGVPERGWFKCDWHRGIFFQKFASPELES